MKISIQQLTHTYNDVTALDNIDLEIPSGSLFGVIGPDGSGKSTLFRILATLIVPTSGRVLLGDYEVVNDMRALRKHIGYMPGRFSLYPDLTVEENLSFFASIFGTTIETHRSLIEPIYKQIEPFKHRRAGALSGGMKQKLALSCALIHRPELLILDEPTTGVDAVSRREFWDLLDMIQAEGITTVVSTPYMDEANRCSEVALLFDGHIVARDTPQTLVDSAALNLYSIQTDEKHESLNMLRNTEEIHWAFSFGDSIHVAGAESLTQEHLQRLMEKEHFTGSVQSIEPSIEDLFIDKTLGEVEV